MEPMIAVEHVTYRYPHSKEPALRDVALHIPAGSFVAVVGANGAGKSTLCATLAGFVPHHFQGDLSGRVLVDRLDTTTTPLTELVPHVGLIFQNPYNQLSGTKSTVEEEVAFGLENLGVPRMEMRKRVKTALELVGLAQVAARSPYELSGGQVQRVALACILVMEPRVLVLDEPAAQLDPVGTRELFAALRALVSTRQMTIVLAEQKTEWVAAFADRVIALDHGAIAMDDTTKAVLTWPGLEGIGVRVPRCTFAARLAQEQGLWPREIALPTTVAEAVQGFQIAQTEGVR